MNPPISWALLAALTLSQTASFAAEQIASATPAQGVPAGGASTLEERLQQIVKLVGPDVLPESQRLILFIAELLKDGFLAQSAFDANDRFCSPERQAALLRAILGVYHRGQELLAAGVPLEKIRGAAGIARLLHAKESFGDRALAQLAALSQTIADELDRLDRTPRRTEAAATEAQTDDGEPIRPAPGRADEGAPP